jgi:hypothetical protein
MSALGRDDLSILVADRGFLRALGGLSRHFVFVAENVGSRAGALRRAFSTLRRGGAVLHFPAGQIEPDAQFEPAPERWLGPWQPGVSSLVSACARAGGRLVLAGVCGVHSPHTKRLALNRAAERSGVTTLSPLLQLVQGLRDVQARVHLSSDDSSTRLDARATNAQEPNLRARLVSAIAEARRAS